MLDGTRPSLERQLLSNQIWETVAFIAKAAFMLGLTPWMIRTWGAQGYGEFALASSTFILLSIVDLGIRGRLRVALCQTPDSQPHERGRILGQSAAAFTGIAIAAILLAGALSRSQLLHDGLGISPANHNLLFITTMVTMLVMLSGMLLEPLVPAGRFGILKSATAIGWFLAIPTISAVLLRKGSVTEAVVLWLGCLFLANICALILGRVNFGGFWEGIGSVRFREFRDTLREGFWFNVANTTWFARTYGVTLLISALNGPSTAGVFFILLRLSEIISALGAISSDVSLGQLAQATTVEQRRRRFESSYSWAALFCAHIAIVIGFSTNAFYQIWLRPVSPLSLSAGIVVVALGLGSALNRTATYVAMGLNLVKTAAKWDFVEALVFIGAIVSIPNAFGLVNRLAIASLSACALLPLARAVSRSLSASAIQLWLKPLGSIAPFVAASAVVLLLANLTAQPVFKLLAVSICGGIGLLNIAHWQRGRACSENSTPTTMAPQVPCWTE